MAALTLFSSSSSYSPTSLRFRSLLRRSSGDRSFSVTVSRSPVVISRGLVLSRSSSRIPISKSRIDIEVEDEVCRLKQESEESEEVGKLRIISFEEKTLQFSASSEVFVVYFNKKSLVKSNEKLKTQADKTRKNSKEITMEPNEEGKVYVSVADENFPGPIKEIFKSFASSTDNLKDVFKERDFSVSIPNSSLLSLCGFFSFMITGSISVTRFNIVLGGTFLALSIYGLRSWREPKSSFVALTGQAAIVTVLCLRQACLVIMRPRFSTCIATLISGVVLSMYINRISYSIEQAKRRTRMDT